METNQLIEELESMAAMPEKSGGCGCGGGAASLATPTDDAELMALEAELDALESDVEGPFEASALESALDLDDELEFATALGDDEREAVPTLEEILALAKQYPGLKISFGF